MKDENTGGRILEIDVRGKRGVGYCKSMPGAVLLYQRLLKRAKLQPKAGDENAADTAPSHLEETDPVFTGNHIKLFNGVLRRANAKPQQRRRAVFREEAAEGAGIQIRRLRLASKGRQDRGIPVRDILSQARL